MHHSHIDQFAQQDSPIHRLDARAKLVAVVGYTAVLISYNRYAVAELVPLAIVPAAGLLLSGVPVWFALRRVAVLSPFILMLSLASLLYDRSPRPVDFGPWHFVIAGGYLTAADLALKFILGLTALTAVMCSTPFSLLLEAMRRLGMPRVLTMQLGFVYRYLFVLADQAMRVRRGRDFRGAALAPFSRRLAASGGVVGSMLVRTLDRSERIQVAMAARGFTGQPHSLQRLALRGSDVAMLACLGLFLAFCRFVLA